MKICFDGLSLSKLKGTGLYTYAFGTIDNLLKIYPQAKYDLIWDGTDTIKEWKSHNNISYTNLNNNRIENDFKKLEEFLAKQKFQIYHSFNNGFSIPKKKIGKYVITVHDLIANSDSSLVDIKYLNKFKSRFKHGVNNSDKIIVTSKFLKEEIIKYYDVKNEKIEVIYPSIPNNFRKINEIEYKSFLKDKYDIKDEYILYAGSMHKRKNLKSLIKVFKNIVKEFKNIKLVIVGKLDGKREKLYLELKDYIEHLQIRNSVIFTGTVPYNEMPYFYNGAICSVNLSDYEGFPLSSIESLYCETPVICKDNTSFKETIGDAAYYVKYDLEKELESFIWNIIYHDNYFETIKIKTNLLRDKYSGEDSIKKLINVYESIAYGN